MMLAAFRCDRQLPAANDMAVTLIRRGIVANAGAVKQQKQR